MPRRLRPDHAGAWHHVMNRGIARRTLFESREDVRYFLSRLAHVVHRGSLEVHCWCVMATHFHLLVRSVEGELPAAMQWTQDLYARWFNRRHRRDGPLFRGRYRSKPIESDTHWRAVVRYIDRNAIEARVVGQGADYPYGSARHYAMASGPPWLTRGRVEFDVRRSLRMEQYDPHDYAHVFGGVITPGERYLAERSLSGSVRVPRSIDDLVASAPVRVRSWMRRKAELADGTVPGAILLSPATLRSVVREHRKTDPERRLPPGTGRRSWWDTVEAGLLRSACGWRFDEIAGVAGVSTQAARVRVQCHAAASLQDRPYEESAARIVQEALLREYPAIRRGVGPELG